MKKLINLIIALFGSFATYKYGKDIIIFIISLLPLLELRGGLLAAAILGVSPIRAYLLCIVGNIIPIPFILLFINTILLWMSNCKIKVFNKISKWVDKKGNEHNDSITKYGYYSLILFVGIPLPGTGAWTGALIASLLNMNRKKSFISILIGIVMASIIMMLISYGVVDNLLH